LSSKSQNVQEATKAHSVVHVYYHPWLYIG